MSQSEPTAVLPEVESALISQRRGFSLIWLLPVLAALFGIWLIWRSIADAGITVTLTLADGAGITPNQTPVRYAGITVGHVTSMALQDDLTGVEVTLEINRSAERLLREETQFWLVSPQVSLAGITGLETLVSGNYIALRPGGGAPQTRFTALAEKPAVDSTGPGLHLVLVADDLGSLTTGSPVLYQKVEVGSVQDYALRDDGSGVDIRVVIKPEYRHHVNRSSRFWNASGIDIRGGLRGFEVQTGPLVSMLRGGIMFHTPADGEPVGNGAEFELFSDHRRAAAGLRIELNVPSPEGIQAGQTEIRYRGFRLGRIERLSLNPEDPYNGAVAIAQLTPEAEPYLLSDAHFWLVRPRLSVEGISGLDALLGGPYIELAPGHSGAVQRRFELLEQPPILDDDRNGLHLWLRTESLGSLARGTAIHYRRVKVGAVQDFALRADGKGIDVRIQIDEEYAHLINDQTRFWSTSGLDVSGGLDGIRVRAESLVAMITGGVSFSTPEGGTPVEDGHVFPLYDNRIEAEQRGVVIDLYLPSAEGLKVGSPLRYQGVTVGEVASLDLTSDLGGVIAQVRLDRQSHAIAREGSRFWVVRPEFGLLETRNLDTLIRGAYLQVTPGQGAPASQFTALASAPFAEAEQGLPVVLEAPRLGAVRRGLKVYYRDIAVGVVADHRLADPADQVEIELRIEPQYAHLVRAGTRFFSVSGLQVDAGLFRGLNVNIAPLETLIAGGIGFATPSTEDQPAAPYDRYALYSRAEPEWLEWRPRLRMQP